MDRLARREYGRAELASRLAGDGFDRDVADAAVERLAAEGLQDDARFAESLVRSRIRQGQGPVRILKELEQRGIDPEVAERAIDECGEDWEALARRVRERRFGPGKPKDFPEKARQMRFLEYRGFEPDQITAAFSDP
jgi:regulatory protein